ncbi:MAG: hypothetical protein MK135_02325 [Polyangiaceae bacterium]|nr:hypothetical protein [Polyangiaceae bacterium]
MLWHLSMLSFSFSSTTAMAHQIEEKEKSTERAAESRDFDAAAQNFEWGLKIANTEDSPPLCPDCGEPGAVRLKIPTAGPAPIECLGDYCNRCAQELEHERSKSLARQLLLVILLVSWNIGCASAFQLNGVSRLLLGTLGSATIALFRIPKSTIRALLENHPQWGLVLRRAPVRLLEQGEAVRLPVRREKSLLLGVLLAALLGFLSQLGLERTLNQDLHVYLLGPRGATLIVDDRKEQTITATGAENPLSERVIRLSKGHHQIQLVEESGKILVNQEVVLRPSSDYLLFPPSPEFCVYLEEIKSDASKTTAPERRRLSGGPIYRLPLIDRWFRPLTKESSSLSVSRSARALRLGPCLEEID